ncbi:MAG: glycosyl hydrolase [Ruminococcus sp.]|nr:glycosyl hydrolase [Ruminococcus sp.]
MCDRINNNRKVEEWMNALTLEEKVSLYTGKNFWQTQNIDRLGIPSVTVSDGTNGVRFQKGSKSEETLSFTEAIKGSFDNEEAIENTYPATCFPTGSAVACSWNKELMKQIGGAIARECRALGIDVILGPGINTRRHPLTARNYEYYSEDPCLAGDMAAAIVNGIQDEGIGTSIKHFACHNSDSYRTRVNVNVNERALREIYLACFERAIKKSDPTTVMSAYNKVNGEEASGNSRLVRDILKKEWGYQGTVLCDWGAVKDVAAAVKGGIDLQMPHCEASKKQLLREVNEGNITLEELDERVRSVLKLAAWCMEQKKEAKEINMELHHELAAAASAESAVLLKNEDHILPIETDKVKKIAVIGRLAKEPAYQGSGCAVVNPVKVEIPFDCIKEECENIADGRQIEVCYAEGYDRDGKTSKALLESAGKAAANADIVFLFVGNSMPEESDDYNRKDISIEEGHKELIEAVSVVNGNLAVVAASGEVIEMPWADKAKAILEMWFGGEGMGKACAGLLFGRKNPSGRLSATMPVKLSDTPGYLGFTGRKFDIDYNEGIYVGYRYYDKKELEPLYPFGYGLSYTEFHYSNMKLSKNIISNPEDLDHEKLRVTVEIENTGERDGMETVQLYIAEENPSMPRPVRELKGFEKVFIKAKEKQTVAFELEMRDFAYYHDEANAFVVDADCFAIEIGASSRDIRLTEKVKILKTSCPHIPLRMDCGFTELFENPAHVEAFDQLLVENGLLRKEEADDAAHDRMLKSFWAVGSYLDMNSQGEISWDMLKDFLTKLNED